MQQWKYVPSAAGDYFIAENANGGFNCLINEQATDIDRVFPDHIVEAIIYRTPETAEQHNITVVVDPADYVSESNETNNYMTMSIDLMEENNAIIRNKAV
jgi:hypothetical protein